MKRGHFTAGIITCLAAIASGNSAFAAITTYTDRTAFEAALSTTPIVENFNSQTQRLFTNPINETGFNFFYITGDTDGDNVGIFDGSVGGNSDGSQYLGWNGSGSGPTYNFIFEAHVTAFGFDWVDTDTTDCYGLKVVAGGVEYTYSAPPFSTSTGSGFFGVISDEAFSQATIYNTAAGGTINEFGLDTFTMQTILAVTTDAVTNIGGQRGTSGGEITVYDSSAEPITARGVCWNTTGSPTTADSCTSNGTGDGTFTSSISGLTPLTTYYVRAYAISTLGTTYGNEVNFTTTEYSFVWLDFVPAITNGLKEQAAE